MSKFAPKGGIFFQGLARVASCDTGRFASVENDVWKECTVGTWVRMKLHSAIASTLYRALCDLHGHPYHASRGRLT